MDAWKTIKELGRKKRANNRSNSTDLLEEEGIDFTTHNNGVHLVVDGRIDFWPSTGKFTVRGGDTGRGVFNLIKLCKETT